jgi:SAM-dependent methyltransferase
MRTETYAVEAEVEEAHWWFVGRRRLFGRELARAGLSVDARTLDVGTSTGSNLRLLRDRGFTHVTGLDTSLEAIRFCASKGFGRVELGSVCAMPFPDGSFDLVLATDVIEHVDDDVLALREVARVLAPKGRVLITVPAFPSLWGLQDEVARHKRRYRLRPLVDLVRGVGLQPFEAFHFNFVLFAPIWLARQIIRYARVELRSEGEVNTPSLNRLLGAIFRADVSSARWLRPPFGVSILLLAEKPASAGEAAVQLPRDSR